MRDLDLAIPTSDGVATLQAVAVSVAGLRNVMAVNSAPEQVTVTETWRPLWTLLVAFFLFPFGLFALLHQRQSGLVVTVRGDTLHIAGEGHEHVCDPVLAAARAGAVEPALRTP